MESLKDIARFIMARKKYWLIPILLFIIILGLIVVFAGNTVLAPFIYSLF